MPIKWTSEMDQKLFAYFLKIHQVQPNYDELAKAMGEEVTKKALVHRFAKIRSMIAAPGADGEAATPEGAEDTLAMANDDSGEAVASTEKPKPKPRVRKAPGTPRAPRTPKAVKNGDAAADDSPTPTATKRKPRTPMKKNAAIASDANGTNGTGETENGAGNAEEEGGPPSKKAKTTRAPRKNPKAAKNPDVEIVKREEGTMEMVFEMEGKDLEEDGESGEESGGDADLKEEEE